MRNCIKAIATSTGLLLTTTKFSRNTVLSFQIRNTFHKRATFTKSTLPATSGSTDATFPPFTSQSDYITYLSSASALPSGFSVGIGKGTFISRESPEMGSLPIRATVVSLENPTTAWAGMFTKNMFPGAPILVGRERLERGAALQCIVINNKVSNVCTETGVEDAERVSAAAASLLDLSGGEAVLPSSTGVIGWTLPADEIIRDILPDAIKDLKGGSALPMAQAIMTTDRYPKLRSRTLSSGARIVGVAKGAGMIEPNMATMLCFLLTDAELPKDSSLQEMLNASINKSFNCISVDSDESTSDTAILISSSRIPTSDASEFQAALDEISAGLSQDVVRNGEGTSHVMQVTVENYAPLLEEGQARSIAKKIVNSPLFKCAVAGNDPNVGRLASAIGSFLGKYFPEGCSTLAELKKGMSLTMGDNVIFSDGTFKITPEKELLLSDYMKDALLGEEDDFPRHQKTVQIGVDFGGDGGKVVVYGSDLTHEYVSINADYRS